MHILERVYSSIPSTNNTVALDWRWAITRGGALLDGLRLQLSPKLLLVLVLTLPLSSSIILFYNKNSKYVRGGQTCYYYTSDCSHKVLY